MTDVRALLEAATTIELIDWPHPSVPATLDRAGFVVVGHEPDSLKSYVVVEEPTDLGDTFPLDDGVAFVDGESIATAVARLGISRGPAAG